MLIMDFSRNVKIFILLYIISNLGIDIYAQSQEKNKLALGSNDRWCAIGNSITHQGRYLEMIYLYYITRYPNQRFHLFNCGAGGDTATGTLTRRMDKDILVHNPTVATIMLGMNDIWWENSGLYPKEYYSKNLEEIVDRLESQNCRVILIAPSPYDYSVKSNEPLDTKRLGLERLADEVIVLGKKKNLPVVDFYNPMLQLTLKQQVVDSTFSLLIEDRVHTKPLADFIMGYTFLKATNELGEISRIELDASEGSILVQENCVVNKLKSDNGILSFSVLQHALPYPQTAIPEGAETFINFNDQLNKELLTLRGLDSGLYALYIDDIFIEELPHSVLKEGINLSQRSQTPQQKQAEQLSEIISEYTSIVGTKLRYIAMIEYGELRKRYDIDDIQTPSQDIKERFPEDQERFSEYLAIKKDESIWLKRVQELNEKLWIYNKPTTHYYRIEKRSN